MSEEQGIRLKDAARSGSRDALEEAWLEALEDPGPATSFLEALGLLDDQRVKDISLALLPLVLETYEGLERHEDALAVARRLAIFKPEDSAARRALLRHLRACFKSEPWFEGFLRASQLEDRIPMDEGLRLFDAFAPYKPGSGVEHGRGWGIGVIDGFNEESWDLKVRFEDGFTRELPLTSALESLTPLDDDDLRVMLMTRPDVVRTQAMEDPSGAIRSVLAFQRGKPLNAAKVKEALVDKVIPSADWSRWWTRAKKAAAQDPYIQVEGGSRPLFQLRDEPVSIEEEAMAAVGCAGNLIEAVKMVRDYLAAKPGKKLRDMLFDEIEGRLGRARESGESRESLLDGTLLLEEQGRNPSTPSAMLIRDAIHLGEDRELADTSELLASLPTDKSRYLALHTLKDALPEEWPGLIGGAYADLPRDLLDPAMELLMKHGHTDRVIERFKVLMEAPWHHPWPIFYLSRRFASGGFEECSAAPSLPEVALAMLKCLESPLFHTKGAKNARREVIKRYEELFFDPKRKLIERFVEQGERSDLVRAMDMVHITSQLPESLQEYFRSEISYRYPELVVIKKKPFWEEDYIYCTLKGIEQRNLELKTITEEKLPEIFKAIGKAADFGDLSENAEWTAALEEQRLLTEKASEIEEELGKSRSIEDQRRPEDTVCPGCRVSVRRVEDGSSETLTILGPWDVGEPGVVSYKAPLAASLLGAKTGDTVMIKLPDKSYEVEILSVELHEG
jgi:transcription elongation factor GreA